MSTAGAPMHTPAPEGPDLEEASADREAFLRTAAARAGVALADAAPCRLDAEFAARRALAAAAAAADDRAVFARLETDDDSRLDALPDLARGGGARGLERCPP